MKRRLYLVAVILFALALVYDFVVWGAVPNLGKVGEHIEYSAGHEAPLAAAYIGIGRRLDAAVPAFGRIGEGILQSGLSDGFQRIGDDANVAMDLIFSNTWNGTHRWIKTVYWAAPVLLVLALLLWWRRPKQVSMIRTRGR